jgi:hypothetical protein
MNKLPFWKIAIGLGLLLAVAILPAMTQENPPDLTDYRTTLLQLVAGMADLRLTGEADMALIADISASGDALYIAPLIDIAYFVRNPEGQRQLLAALAALSGQTDFRDWVNYFEWAGETNIALPPHYAEFKGALLSTLIDPQFARFFAPGVQATAQVNLVEAVWGGVRVDGIPSLVNARQITPAEAQAEGVQLREFCVLAECPYPEPDEYVFGVYLNGDARAYPLRLLNWHEMFNDVIGHTPLYTEPNGEQVCYFRAPTTLRVAARAGEDWLLIRGVSAGCPEEGWLATDAIEWTNGIWERIRDRLPDVAQNADPLPAGEGFGGRVKGKPVMLAYCTLCGSGILYDVTLPSLSYTDTTGKLVELGETVLEFGSTGMLMRSNKLMYDRLTDTVWNALTGTPAFGALATSNIELPLLPVVVTDWASWLAQHPDTSVLSLRTGYQRDYSNGAAYRQYFNSPNLMFPVWQQNTETHDLKDMVFGLRLDGIAKAYPLDILIAESLTHDTIGATQVLLVTQPAPTRNFFEPGGAAVRAYAVGDRRFSVGVAADELIADDGTNWQITEDALIAPNGDTVPRLPGHLAFWFGWFSFFPDTLVYGAA